MLSGGIVAQVLPKIFKVRGSSHAYVMFCSAWPLRACGTLERSLLALFLSLQLLRLDISELLFQRGLVGREPLKTRR